MTETGGFALLVAALLILLPLVLLGGLFVGAMLGYAAAVYP